MSVEIHIERNSICTDLGNELGGEAHSKPRKRDQQTDDHAARVAPETLPVATKAPADSGRSHHWFDFSVSVA
jgi:hypothetical protein